MNRLTTPSQPGCSPCAGFPGGANCSTIQVLDPQNDVLTATMSGATDPTLDERGDVPLGTDQTEVQVLFQVPKAGDYRFEYLYVDAFGLTQPGTIKAVPVVQTTTGFTVELAGAPRLAGYVLRWRVVVMAITSPAPPPDPPESLRLQLLQDTSFDVYFNVARTTLDYGFTELRVENLDDLPGQQVIVTPQVVLKQYDHFVVKLSQAPPTDFYYLVVRTP